MEEHELAITRLFNEYVPTGFLSIFGMEKWENWLVMELLVIALLVIAVAALKSSLSVDKPGALQHLFESITGFIKTTVDEAGIHHGEKYVPYVGTIFIFILSMNLIGLIPGLESPTMAHYVPAGLAVVTFLWYNSIGIKTHGPGYLKHFLGPVWWLIPLLLPIELISHFVRPLSLTVRLYGNMFGGEQVTNVFLEYTKLIIPVIFMALHVFVALVQAYVFTLLTTIYIAGAASHEH
jgi:F-type H+-transporting ATPase subunit a